MHIKLALYLLFYTINACEKAFRSYQKFARFTLHFLKGRDLNQQKKEKSLKATEKKGKIISNMKVFYRAFYLAFPHVSHVPFRSPSLSLRPIHHAEFATDALIPKFDSGPSLSLHLLSPDLVRLQ